MEFQISLICVEISLSIESSSPTHKVGYQVVSLGTRAPEHNWGEQVIDGCSLELCVATLSVASPGMAPQEQTKSSIARKIVYIETDQSFC